jgi:signal transduction histidine kinase
MSCPEIVNSPNANGASLRDAYRTSKYLRQGYLLQPGLGALISRGRGTSSSVKTSGDAPARHFNVVAALSAAGVAVCAAGAALTLSGSQSANPALEAEVRAAIIAAPIAAGIYVWNRDPWTRFARLLLAAGFAWSLTTLAQSGNDVLYSTGRVFGWFVEPLLIYLMLAFPSGRLTTRLGRVLVGASVLLVALFYLPTALFVDSYPTPSPWSGCDESCPGNAFMLVGSEPGLVGSLIVPLREAATMILFAGVIAVLASRIARGTRLMRITLVPALTIAILNAAALIAGIVVRRAAPDASAAEFLSTVVALSSGGVALGFMAGLSGWRLFENRALRRLAAGFASHRPALSLRETSELLSDTIDPSLEVVHRHVHRQQDEPDGWLDTQDRPASAGGEDGVRCVTEVCADDERVVAVVHDAALRDAPTVLDVARSSLLKALENERLGTELRSSLRELRESRARIMTSADRERQRIEQGLHDGAQQSLVALRIRLELAGQLLGESPARAEQLLRELATEVDGALEDVRSLARGVYPSLLAARGLSEALSAAALRSPVRTTIDADGVGRYPPEVEAAAYFCCLEAIQNAMKHARGVQRISVSIAVKEDLRFEVRDDGAGFAEAEVASGSGLTNMRDRLAAVGGLLLIRAAPGAGTSVVGIVPLNVNGSRELRDTGRAAVL